MTRTSQAIICHDIGEVAQNRHLPSQPDDHFGAAPPLDQWMPTATERLGYDLQPRMIHPAPEVGAFWQRVLDRIQQPLPVASRPDKG